MDICWDLGVEGLRPFDIILRERSAWSTLVHRLDARPFLHSEGLSTELGVPHRLEGGLLAEARAIVERFDALYRGLIRRYYAAAASLAEEYLVNPLFGEVLDAEREVETPLPLSRFDCVLDPQGRLRVIELNPVGVCTLHIQTATYLARAMRGGPFASDAGRVRELSDAMVDAVARQRAQVLGSAAGAPRLGFLGPANMYRASRVMAGDAFKARGFDHVDGQPDRLEIDRTGARLNGRGIDTLWADFLFYLGYQYARYTQTRFASKVGDYTAAPAATERLVRSPPFLDALRGRRLCQVSPSPAYLALSKHLLSFVHRDDAPIGAADRAWLAEHVARTYGLRERQGGTITLEQARRSRGDLVLKPCQYGGAHGVVVGADTDELAWTAHLTRTWDDAGWVLQDFHVPRRTPDGQWLSFGLYNYGGQFGGMTCRYASSLIVSARRSTFVPISSTA